MAGNPERRAFRRQGRRAVRALLFLAPVLQAGLAMRAGMGWELVALLGAGLALVAGLGRVRAPMGLALLLAASALLVQGAGHGVVPGWVVGAVAVGGAGLLLDGRALGIAFGVMVAAALVGDGGAAAVQAPVAMAGVVAAVQAGLRAMPARVEVLRPVAARPVLRPMAAPAAAPDFVVQAERGPEGAVRLMVAGRMAGKLRVSVC